MPNNSASGGYLVPSASPAPLESQALLDFLQAWIVGITGMVGTLVRPYWQSEPPDIPNSGTAWCAFKVTTRPTDEYPFVGFNYSTDDYELQRHETLSVLTSFYDLGSGGQADYLATLFRDGTSISQNREPLQLANMGLIRVGTLVAVPVILKLRWQYRVDLDLLIRREITRVYPVETITSAAGDLYTDTGLPPEPFSAEGD